MKKIISIVLLLFALASCGKAEDTPQTETQTQEYQDMEPLRSSDSGWGGEWAIESWTRD